jgi:hypothetical protein
MHDGVPAHFLLAVRELLNNVFPEQRLGQGGPTACPVRSPDLNPLHFYLWGHYTLCDREVSDVQGL